MKDTFLVPEDLWRPIAEGDIDPEWALDVIETRRRFEDLLARRGRRRADNWPRGPIDPRLSWLLRGSRDRDLC
jgi:hypothetical protein